MGSGKGRSRRVLVSQPGTAKASQKKTSFQGEVWGRFLHDSKITHYNLYKYYGLPMENRLRQTPTVEDYEKVFTELFADAVAIGVITLPSPWTLEDFRFKMKTNTSGSSTYGRITMELVSHPGVDDNLGHPYHHLDKWTTLTNWYVKTAMSSAKESAQRLIDKVECLGGKTCVTN